MIQGSPAWLAWRRGKASTCSEYANAIGVGYEGRQTYMKRKLGMVPQKEANWMMIEGIAKEAWVVNLYETVMRDHYGIDVKLFVDGGRDDPSDARFGGSVDRLVQLPSGEIIVLECKTAYSTEQRTEIPHGHLLQMLGLCHAYGAPYAHYACWQEGVGFFVARVDFAPDLWSKEIYPRLTQFAAWKAMEVIPPRMPGDDRLELIKIILAGSIVSSIAPDRSPQ